MAATEGSCRSASPVAPLSSLSPPPSPPHPASSADPPAPFSLRLFRLSHPSRPSRPFRARHHQEDIRREAQTMTMIGHPNLVRAHCSFVGEQYLWVVMPFMDGGSCLHIMKSCHMDGLDEPIIATVLRETLKGLDYLHRNGHIHRDVKAGNILIDAVGNVRLADFGVSACMFDTGDRLLSRKTFVGTPCWMAPEVLEQLHGYDYKYAPLPHGPPLAFRLSPLASPLSSRFAAFRSPVFHSPTARPPRLPPAGSSIWSSSSLPPPPLLGPAVLLMTLQGAPPGLDLERDRRFSKSFKEIIAMCLVKEPSKRPTAEKLMKHAFFKQARDADYVYHHLLHGLPTLGERVQMLK
ncbi:unnamed protein product, partial [Closterium sp. NIES-54]